jgi:DNA-binding IclR family transcriptional regulator
LTNEIPYEKDLVNAAKDVMDELTATVNETCILGVLRNHKRYILHAVNANQEIQVQLRSERNIYETASGRLLLAYLSEKEMERHIQQTGLPDISIWKEAQTNEKLISALAQIKKEGIAKTHLTNRHVKGFAVPIFAHDKALAGLSVFLPEYRCSALREKEIIQAIKASAEEISKKLKIR